MVAVRLTEKSLLEIVPPAGVPRVLVRDAELPGFIVVVGARARTFFLDCRVGGARRKVPIGRHGVMMPDGREPWNVARARARARVLLGQVAEGRDPVAERTPRAAGPTLRDGLELHLDNLRKRRKSEKTIETYEGDIKRHLDGWLDRPMVELTALELDRLHKSVRKDAAQRLKREGRKVPAGQANAPGEALANRIVRHIKALWNTLDKVHELPGRNPARGVTPVELAARNTRIATDAFPAWWATIQGLNPVRRDLYTLALLTGIRSDGIRHVREEDFDAIKGRLCVTHAKGGKPYTIPLGPRAVSLIEARIADNADRFREDGGPDGWIFPSYTRAKVKVGRQLRRKVVAQAGARDRDKETGGRRGMAIHDLRRTYASVAKEIGVPLEARETLMNHTSRAINDLHYARPEVMDNLATHQRAIEAALYERIERLAP